MKLLKIREQKGFFINPSHIDKEKSIDNQYKNIEMISKEDILSMIDFIMENDIEMDEYKETLLPNPAQKIIYENLYNHLSNLKNCKDDLIKQTDKKFKDAEEKYLK